MAYDHQIGIFWESSGWPQVRASESFGAHVLSWVQGGLWFERVVTPCDGSVRALAGPVAPGTFLARQGW